jgi:multisubunit Na+/H+ antiporter MnhG subunit
MTRSPEVTRRPHLETAINIIGLIACLLIVVAIAWYAAGIMPTELEGH